MLSPTLETDPALTASTKARVVSVVTGGGAASFLPYPPGLPEDARPGGASGPDWMEVMSHMALRLTWVDPGFAMDVFAHDAPLEDIQKSAAIAVFFVVVGVGDGELSAALRDALPASPPGRRSDAAARWQRSRAWRSSP